MIKLKRIISGLVPNMVTIFNFITYNLCDRILCLEYGNRAFEPLTVGMGFIVDIAL